MVTNSAIGRSTSSLTGPPRTAELQLRTHVQQGWAQLVERLDQTLGTDFKHGAGPSGIQDWLRTMSTEGRKAELGLAYALPPFPEEPK
jgi:hypothetical protein